MIVLIKNKKTIENKVKSLVCVDQLTPIHLNSFVNKNQKVEEIQVIFSRKKKYSEAKFDSFLWLE